MSAPSPIYAIGDIHGHLAKLQEVHGWIAEDRRRTGAADAPVVHVGDLVDRGPDSAGVIAFLQSGLAEGEPWITLKGNHDRMFTNFLDEPDGQDSGLRVRLHWLDPRLGGGTTLRSFGVKGINARPIRDIHADALGLVPDEVRDFLRDLPLTFQWDEALFVHAGIRPGRPLVDQVEDDLVWIRDEFLNDTRDHGALIVHGHTPVERATHYRNRLNIDSGAAYGGPLTAVAIEGRKVWRVGPDGRMPIEPV